MNWKWKKFLPTFNWTYFLARKHKNKYDVIIALCYCVIYFVIELIKHLMFVRITGMVSFDKLPLNYCSMTFYFFIAAIIIPNKKWKDRCYLIGSYVGVTGALMTCINPSGFYNQPYIYHTIYQIIHHSLLFVSSLFIIISRKLYLDSRKIITIMMAYTFIYFIFTFTINIVLFKTVIEPNGWQESNFSDLGYTSYFVKHNVPIGFLEFFKVRMYPLYLLLYYIGLIFFNTLYLMLIRLGIRLYYFSKKYKLNT